MTKVFIEGSAGTVGMALRPFITQMQAEGLISGVAETIRVDDRPEAERMASRERLAAWADVAVLCLPDEAAVETVERIRRVNPRARILDASAAHRCSEGWTYGLPEVTAEAEIARAQYVANPGCFATGCILLARPLRALLNASASANAGARPWVPFQGITGYSAGGRKAVQGEPRLVQLGSEHRHLPEIARYAGVSPVLTTLVGDWYQGMLVQATVGLGANLVYERYLSAYGDNPGITVTLADADHRRLSATEANGTNDVHIVVAKQLYGGTTVAASYDNLGKGAAGAAAHNLRLMLEGVNHA